LKCLFVSDLHYALKQFDWVSSEAAHFDLIVIGGDHLDISSATDIRVQTMVILKYLKQLRTKTRVLVCSGNHDLDMRDVNGEKVARWIARARAFGIYTDCTSVEIDGILFTVCPWWDGPLAKQQVADILARDATRPKDRWVWVYHSPPSNSPTSWVGRKHIGDEELATWIERYQPEMVLTGHIHQSPFVDGGSWVDQVGKTWVFNPGRQIGPWPTRIMFDTDTKAAVWLSLAGAEMVMMDQALSLPVPGLESLPPWVR
jgi:Icc-related predicted phosphoesterase